VTLAENAIVIAAPKQGKLELHLQGGTTHEFSREDADHYSVTAFGQSDWPIEFSGLAVAQRGSSTIRAFDSRIARRITDRGGAKPAGTAPPLCVSDRLLCLCADRRSAGRATSARRPGGGALLAVILISSYYLLSVLGAGLARQGTLTPAAGIWIANAVLFALG